MPSFRSCRFSCTYGGADGVAAAVGGGGEATFGGGGATTFGGGGAVVPAVELSDWCALFSYMNKQGLVANE